MYSPVSVRTKPAVASCGFLLNRFIRARFLGDGVTVFAPDREEEFFGAAGRTGRGLDWGWECVLAAELAAEGSEGCTDSGFGEPFSGKSAAKSGLR